MAKTEKYSCNPTIWVDEYSNEFFRFAMYRIKNREVAEDLVQDTFLSGLKALKNFRGESTEKSWLYNILKNKIIDHFRKKTNQEMKRNLSETEIDDDSFYSYFFEKNTEHWNMEVTPKSFESSPDIIMESDEFMQFLLLCLSLLPDLWEKVFRLKNIEDLSTPDICKELDITSSNLWTIIHRAKLQLRGCLEKRWKEK